MPKSNNKEFFHSNDFFRGNEEIANYKLQHISEHQGNPLIEALPKILSTTEFVNNLVYFPKFSVADRNLPAEERLHLLDNAREFYLPQSRHTELYYAVSNMIRRGYINRNPMQKGYWNYFNQKMTKMREILPSKEIKEYKPSWRSKARGLTIVGEGGTGKTSAIESILNIFPQVITHAKYDDKDLILKQLVWLKIDCPQDGSIKGLCQEFFHLVDEVLNTNYANYYGKKGNTVDEMLLNMARVSAMHSLGALIIDEIQDLNLAKSGGAAHMLNFFVHLENRIGVPFIFIGTPKALPLFKGEFRQARRASEQGDFVWERMKKVSVETQTKKESKNDTASEKTKHYKILPDRDWEDYITTLWTYQYIQKPQSLAKNILEDELADLIYNFSQGIPAVAGTIFMLAQMRAITSGKEELTESVIKSVEKDRLNLVRGGIDSFRLGNSVDKSSFANITPAEYKELLAKIKLFEAGKLNQEDNEPSLTNSKEKKLNKGGETEKTDKRLKTKLANQNKSSSKKSKNEVFNNVQNFISNFEEID